jgi:hypothetical protein
MKNKWQKIKAKDKHKLVLKTQPNKVQETPIKWGFYPKEQ